ncbi:hypothetical protein [Paenibacillus cineris]|uniref:Uncharacterized protein n=1 Tax=Paenibacillus cineris TaxID=237530 RepID=A0ABQ4LJ48_9BACL|nr:hypothetical protein [Paenibacillus cineris]GIO56532.1 hypothetical protein J21TS7_48500 [Paenibacillus cineris]
MAIFQARYASGSCFRPLLLANFWEWTMRKKFAHKGGRCRFSSMNPASPAGIGEGGHL